MSQLVDKFYAHIWVFGSHVSKKIYNHWWWAERREFVLLIYARRREFFKNFYDQQLICIQWKDLMILQFMADCKSGFFKKNLLPHLRMKLKLISFRLGRHFRLFCQIFMRIICFVGEKNAQSEQVEFPIHITTIELGWRLHNPVFAVKINFTHFCGRRRKVLCGVTTNGFFEWKTTIARQLEFICVSRRLMNCSMGIVVCFTIFAPFVKLFWCVGEIE